MDFSKRRWTASAVMSLFAAGLLAFATFLPVFIGDDDMARNAVEVHIRPTGWSGGVFGSGYLQLFGAALALTAGLVAAITAQRGTGQGRKGGLVLLVASGAFNAGVASVVGTVLNLYFTMYPAYDGPDGRASAAIGVGTWCLVAGLLLALAAVVVVLPQAGKDVVNRRWGTVAALSLVAAVLLTLAAFLPRYQTSWDDTSTRENWRITVNAWGATTTVNSAPTPMAAFEPLFPSGYMQLAGAALALAGGLLALFAARRIPRGGTASMILLVGAGAFNVVVTVLLVGLLDFYFTSFASPSRSGLRIFDIGLGSWSLFAGAIFCVLALVTVLARKPEPQAVSAAPVMS